MIAAYFPLARAVLCVSCMNVSDGRRCPHCGSDEVFPIARWLEREEDEARR